MGGIRQVTLIPAVADVHVETGEHFRYRISDHDSGTGIHKAPGGEQTQKGHHNSDAHKLFKNLGTGGYRHTPPGHKIASEAVGYGHKRKAGSQDFKGHHAAHILDPVPAYRIRAKEQQTSGQQSQQRAEQHDFFQQPNNCLWRTAAHFLHDETGNRHRDAGGGQCSGQDVHREDQLIKAHPFAAQLIGDVYPEKHSDGAKQQSGGR